MSDEKHINVSSYNQSGGITAYQVILESGDRVLNDNLISQLKTILDQENFKFIDVTAVMGDQEAFRFATQFKNFLTAEGYDVHGVNLAIFKEPTQGQIIETPDNGEKLRIIIGGK